MELNKKEIMADAKELFFKHLLQPMVEKRYDWVAKLEYYHLITDELKDHLVNIVEESMIEPVQQGFIVGEYCCVRLYGEAVSNEKLISLRDNDAAVDELWIDVESWFVPKFKDMYHPDPFHEDELIRKEDISEFLVYSTLRFLNKK
jgi:hypothetical protein